LLGLVITGEAVDAGFDEDEAELRVLVLAVGLEVFADRDGFLYKVPEVFWDLWGEACNRSEDCGEGKKGMILGALGTYPVP
jgi:hypothetical protein